MLFQVPDSAFPCGMYELEELRFPTSHGKRPHHQAGQVPEVGQHQVGAFGSQPNPVDDRLHKKWPEQEL
jgi:hypothetical protein